MRWSGFISYTAYDREIFQVRVTGGARGAHGWRAVFNITKQKDNQPLRSLASSPAVFGFRACRITFCAGIRINTLSLVRNEKSRQGTLKPTVGLTLTPTLTLAPTLTLSVHYWATWPAVFGYIACRLTFARECVSGISINTLSLNNNLTQPLSGRIEGHFYFYRDGTLPYTSRFLWHQGFNLSVKCANNYWEEKNTLTKKKFKKTPLPFYLKRA